MWTVCLSALAAPLETLAHDAGGLDHSVVGIPAFGRVAFEVRSASGTAIQLVDRDAGPGRWDGEAGVRDGRIDAFLDVGEVRVNTAGPRGATGQAVVTVTPFARVGDPEQLPFRRPVITELADRQARGWWIDPTEPQPLAVEAVGRHLADLRVWRDGTWLVDGVTRCAPHEPEDGRPLTRCTLTANLEPGLYEVVAYGGPGAPWANEAADQVLTVRWDLPELPDAGRRVGRIGPSGIERFRVPAGVDLAHLSLPEIAVASVELAPYTPEDPFDRHGRIASIGPTSRTPEATARGGSSAPQALIVRGPPGQRYTLDWFDAVGLSTSLTPRGQVAIASLTAGNPGDDLRTTAVFYPTSSKPGPVLPMHDAAIPVGSGKSWTQRFNLLGPAEILIRADKASPTVIEATEGDVDLLVEPLFLTAPKDYRAPEPRRQKWAETLGAGLYRVRVTPRTAGIVTLAITPNGWSDLLSTATPTGAGPGVLTVLDLSEDAAIRLFGPSGQERGLVVRELPLDPRSGMPLPLAPGQSFALPVKVDAPTRVRAQRPDGERLRLSVLERSDTELLLQPGTWSVTVHNDGDSPVLAVFDEVPAPDPHVRIPPGRLAAIPDLPLVTPEKPAAADLDTGGELTLRMRLPRDGVWTLESTGLLATRGTLRSRVQLNLGMGDQNGVGRNFRVSRGLRSGDYQVTVGVQGQSAGHLGVRLTEAPTRDGGTLEDGVPARITLPARESVAYRFTVDEVSTWRVRSAGASRPFPCRIEDADGWPVEAPANACDRTLTLQPGTYVVRGLPEAVETRRHTTAERLRSDPQRAGHGPFALTLGEPASHVWSEPPGTGERPTDTWTFELPADSEVRIDAGDAMGGSLLRDGEVVARLLPRRAWTGDLTRGTYTLALQAARRGTGIPYALGVHTDALTVGQAREVHAPRRLPVRIGSAGLVTFTSAGDRDVRARLIGPDGEIVAANDDRPDDWNFRISAWLEPGQYTLEVGADGYGGSSQIRVSAPVERVAEPLRASGRPVEVPLDGQAAVHLVDLPKGREVLRIRAESAASMAVGVEMQTAEGWRNLGSAAGRDVDLLAHRIAGQAVRVRLTSLDGRAATARLTLDDTGPRTPAEAALATPTDGLAVVGADALKPGLFRVDVGTVQLCPRPGDPCAPAPGVVALEPGAVLFGRDFALSRAPLDRSVPMELSAEPQPLATGATGLVGLEVRSATSLPGASLADGAVATSADAVFALGTGQAKVWGDGVGRLRVVPLTVTRQPWDRQTPLALTLPPRAALTVPIGRGDHEVELGMERGAAARLGSSALWADADSLRGTLTGGGDLLLANPTDRPVLVELFGSRDAIGPVGAAPVELRVARSGALTLPVRPAGPDARLRAAGGTLTYVRQDGRILRGASLEVGPGGVATLTHGPGWLAVWTEDGAPGPWPDGRDRKPVQLPRGVHRVHVEGPFAARVVTDAGERVVWQPEGGAFDVVVPQKGELSLRALGDGPIPDPIVSAHAITELGEGAGPEVLLDGGGSRWFAFRVTQAGPVGFGVRASADRVTARVLDATGTPLAEGVVGRVALQPGAFWLVLSQGPASAPVRARPALTGIEPPDPGPPEDIVNQYLQAAGGVR